jgi:phosphoheptose isomerase
MGNGGSAADCQHMSKLEIVRINFEEINRVKGRKGVF